MPGLRPERTISYPKVRADSRLHLRPAAPGCPAQGPATRAGGGNQPGADLDWRRHGLGLVVPELDGKLHGYAMRVPIPTGSVVDLTVESERLTSAGEVNDIFAGRADRDELEGILAYSEDPIVSSEIVGSPYSAIFDAGFTSVIDETFVKVLAWYDNEWGYGTRLSELAERVSASVPASV
jgi:glyceraldehyde 3-phosphate dehydrogenase-like protein